MCCYEVGPGSAVQHDKLQQGEQNAGRHVQAQAEATDLAGGPVGPGERLLRGEGSGDPDLPLEKDLDRLWEPPLL